MKTWTLTSIESVAEVTVETETETETEIIAEKARVAGVQSVIADHVLHRGLGIVMHQLTSVQET